MNSRFLTLLTTQLRNQDPLNPMENAEVTSQLAQMSTVDGIERLNKMFQSFVDGQSAYDSMQAAALVGRGVLVEGKKLTLTESGAVGGFELDAPADQRGPVDQGRRRPRGQADRARRRQGGQPELHLGRHRQAMVRVPPTAPTRSRLSALSEGKKVTGRTLEFGPVTSVIRGAAGTDFQVGSLGIFKYDDIKQIL